jgi:sec-independent protein translocase protein TatC
MMPFYSVAAEYPHLVIELGTGTPMEGINIIVQICLLGGLMMSAPCVLNFARQFVAPALTDKELKSHFTNSPS